MLQVAASELELSEQRQSFLEPLEGLDSALKWLRKRLAEQAEVIAKLKDGHSDPEELRELKSRTRLVKRYEK